MVIIWFDRDYYSDYDSIKLYDYDYDYMIIMTIWLYDIW